MAMLDELLAGRDAREAFDSGDLFRGLKKALVERILDAEMDAHLEGGAGRRRDEPAHRARLPRRSRPSECQGPGWLMAYNG